MQGGFETRPYGGLSRRGEAWRGTPKNALRFLVDPDSPSFSMRRIREGEKTRNGHSLRRDAELLDDLAPFVRVGAR